MTPREGKLYIKKNLSRASMRGFPKQITHAGPAGANTEPEKREEGMRSSSSPVQEAPIKPPENTIQAASGAKQEPAGNKAPSEAGQSQEPAGSKAPSEAGQSQEPAGNKAPSKAGQSQEPGNDLLWYRTPDGTLFTKWEGRSFMAVPEAVRGLPMEKCLEHRPIEGQVYAVFETKNGKII
jgi:hypothetical protein